MFCRKCGKEIPDDSDFCPKCGVKAVSEIKEETITADDKTNSNVDLTKSVEVKSDSPDLFSEEAIHMRQREHENIVAAEHAKKNRRKPFILTSVLLVLLAAIIIPIAVTKHKEAHHEFKYHLVNDNYIIDGYFGTDREVIIPDTINNKPVTEIGEKAFCESNITSVKFGKNINKIGKNAFEMCKSLTYAGFRGSNIENFIIDDAAFNSCTSLRIVEMPHPKISTTIGMMAFNNCESLSQINLDNVIAYGMGAFGKTGLSEVRIYAFKKYDDLGSLGVFADCKNLERVYLERNVAEIPQEAFLRCVNLKTVTWDSVSRQPLRVNENAFAGCVELETIYTKGGKENKCPKDLDSEGIHVREGAFQNCDKFMNSDSDTRHNELAGTQYIGQRVSDVKRKANNWQEVNYMTVLLMVYDRLGSVLLAPIEPEFTVDYVMFDDMGRYLSSDLGKTDFICIGMTVQEIFDILGETQIFYAVNIESHYMTYEMYGYVFRLNFSGQSRSSTLKFAEIYLPD